MAIHRLKPRQVQVAKVGKYEDGGGLRLIVSDKGAKKWVLRYTIEGRRREMGLGSFPDVGLGDARDLASEYRQQADKGVDPIEARKTKQVETPSFTSCAARYIKSHRRGWRNRKHARQWVRTLKTYARPLIGEKLVDAISTQDIQEILTPIWNTKTETAKRVQGRIENILDFAAAQRYRDPVNPARWRGHLDKLYPNPSRVKKVKHHPAMPYMEVPSLMVELEQNESMSSRALRFLIMTAARTGEVLNAVWAEFDLEQRVWIIPAERMKMRREHRVPLADKAIEIITSLSREGGSPYLFPGTRIGRPLSSMSLLQLMRGMGYGVGGGRGDYVPHGFRSSFRDWSGEVSTFPRDVAEMALAHAVPNQVEAAYRRGDLFVKRQKMMQQWVNYLHKQKFSAEIIPISKQGNVEK